MRILSFEAEELMDHLRSRPDIWHEGDDLMFVRTDSEGAMLLGLKFIPPKAPGTYSTWMLHTLPNAWSGSDATTYVEQLVMKWTSYSLRKRFFQFFIQEMGLEPRKAETVALICAVMVCEVDPNPEELWQAPLPDVKPLPLLPRVQTAMDRVFMLRESGWLKVILAGGQFAVEMSLPNGDEGRGHQTLRGYVRSQNAGEARDTAAALFGWPMADPDAVVNPEERQQYFGRRSTDNA